MIRRRADDQKLIEATVTEADDDSMDGRGDGSEVDGPDFNRGG
jgi:hypothetical protein